MSKGSQRIYPGSDPEKHTAEATETGVLDENQTKESDDIKAFVDRVIRFVSPAKYDNGRNSGEDSEDDNGLEAPHRAKLPQLGRLDFYDVEATNSDRLWRLEARRLTLAARGPADRLLFSPRHGPAPLDREGFKNLGQVTDQILCALHICTLDDQAVLNQTYSPAVDKWRWTRCQSSLRNRTDDYDLPGMSSRPSRSRSYGYTGARSWGTAVVRSDRDIRRTSVEPPRSTRETYRYYHEEEGFPTILRRATAPDEDDEDKRASRERELSTESSQRRRPEEVQDERKIETVQPASALRNSPPSSVQHDDSLSDRPTAMPPRRQSTTPRDDQSGSVTSAMGISASPTLPTTPQPLPDRAQRKVSSEHLTTPTRVKTIRIITPPLAERREASNPHELQQVADPEGYCAVVDHVTAVLARIATQHVRSPYWRTVVIAVLTMLSTKLKVVAIDLPTYVRDCLLRFSDEVPQEHADSDDGGSNAGLREWQFPRISDNDPTTSRYCLENAAVGGWLTSCLTETLIELGAKRPVHVPIERIDACSMVLRTGADSLLTLVHQDRHGNISGLCDALPLAFSGAAISLVVELGLEMERRRSVTAPPPPPGGNAMEASRPSAVLEASQEWMFDNGEFELRKTSTRLTNIAGVATLLVPLSLAKPSLAHEFKRTLRAISALSAFGDVVPTATDFTALVHLSSEGPVRTDSQAAARKDSARQRRRMSREKSSRDAPVNMGAVKSLSQSALARRRLHLFDPDAEGLSFSAQESSIKATMTAAQDKLNDLRRKTEDWAIDGQTVIVQCPMYVWSILSVCSVLVLGGLMIGFFVGDRIPGVDPFGLASFTWVLAGFIILVAKSVRVSEWPWRDFLHGRVTCRSVTELHSVTRVDAQDIIMYFLSTQERNFLGTCGPFNKPFREEIPGDFSIDVKIKLQTLWSCGIIPLEVNMLEGPKLVLLDLTRGQDGLTSAEHSTEGYAENDRYIACCWDLPPPNDERDAPLLLYRSMVWIKIVGIYNCTERKFR